MANVQNLFAPIPHLATIMVNVVLTKQLVSVIMALVDLTALLISQVGNFFLISNLCLIFRHVLHMFCNSGLYLHKIYKNNIMIVLI